MTWAQFKALTLIHITDRAPNETNFTASVAEFALARISRDVLGDANGYALRQNRYTATRRALAGFVSAQSAGTLKAAVRLLMSEGPIDNVTFAAACACYVRERLAREIDARSAEDGGQSALAIAEAARKDYQTARLRLLGYVHTFANTAALKAEVVKHLPVDAVRLNTSGFIDVQLANAVLDLQSFGPWLDNVIVTARDDIEALNTRVFQELRNGVLDLINFIQAYREEAGEELILTCEGVEVTTNEGDFELTKLDAETVPFNEVAAQAVGFYIKSKLALEWGESMAGVQLAAGAYQTLRTRLYLRNK